MHGFEAISRRIIALSRVYDHLLGTGLQQNVDVSEYSRHSVRDLTTVESAKHPDIKITYDMQRTLVNLDMMSALGLVVTELLANCFEHAFPDDKGSIHISLAMTPVGEKLILTIRDDGVGFPILVNSKRNGIGLVKRLIEQLGGTTTVRSDHGTEWVLTVPTAAATSQSSAVCRLSHGW